MKTRTEETMIVDFHTHIFPDKIAAKTIAHLSEKGGIPAFSDGSVAGLLCQMEQAGVDVAVTLPVLTNPGQFESVNRFAAQINQRFEKESRRLISFAGIHPGCDGIEEKMKWIRENGFLGVKIHPDYQETFICDKGYVRILECAKEQDLIVVTHAGADGAYRDCPMRCPPILAKELIRKVPRAKLVLAHLGGNECFQEVLEHLCGEEVYLDTAYVLPQINKDVFQKILNKHGAERILFASDSPWSSIRQSVSLLREFAPDTTTEERILWKNAKDLLGI